MPKKTSIQSRIQLLKVKVSEITPNPYNYNYVSEDIMNSLRNSLKKLGYFEPIVIREMTDEEQEKYKARYMIVDGEHRWKILKEEGVDEIEVINLGKISAEESIKYLVSARENRSRGEIKPLIIKKAFSKLLEMEGKDPDYIPLSLKRYFTAYRAWNEEFQREEGEGEVVEEQEEQLSAIYVSDIFRVEEVDIKIGESVAEKIGLLKAKGIIKKWEDVFVIIDRELEKYVKSNEGDVGDTKNSGGKGRKKV